MNHLHTAHALWREHLRPGDTAIDATCGNGHDTQILADLVGPAGTLLSYDIQPQALQNAQARLPHQQIIWKHQCHSQILLPARLVVYNLGYLPGGDKSITTQTDTTLKSLKKALEADAISIMCYPGHTEGARELTAITQFLKDLSGWEITPYRWKAGAPTLLWMKQLPQTTSKSPRPAS
jgi:Putative rRNA methylase